MTDSPHKRHNEHNYESLISTFRYDDVPILRYRELAGPATEEHQIKKFAPLEITAQLDAIC